MDATLDKEPGLNPRWLAYCKAHGRTPEATWENDRAKWSGVMCGFILWISQQKREAFAAKHPSVCKVFGDLEIASQDLWDEWLCRDNATKLPED